MSQISEASKTEIAASDMLISNFTACCQSEESEEESLLLDLSALRAEGYYQQTHDAADLCYAAMLNYRSLRIKEQANEAHQIEKGKNHAMTPDKATLVQSDLEDGRISLAANHKQSDVNLNRRFPRVRQRFQRRFIRTRYSTSIC